MIYIDDSEPEGELEPAFPYRDVCIKRNVDANELYDILGEVGRGKFGTVYKCQEKSCNLKLAAKFVPIPKREDKRNVEREVEIMNSLQHHLIIQLYAAYEYQKMMCVVLELVEGGELFDRVVDDEFVLTERVCVVFIRQVCEAMAFIHRKNILHLDLKPENILCLTQEGNRIKLIDFGLARVYDPNKRLQILFGTPEFVAPEVVNFDCISYGTDMWSVGVICYVLISGLSPFMGETDIETMANVTIAKYDFEDESFSSVSSECLDFIAKLLVKDLSTRMTADQCMEHKWLQRRPKSSPDVRPKPIHVPTTTLTPSTPTPTTVHTNENNEKLFHLAEDKGMESTKDNLKNFIERWEEHPNSPYIFDVEGNVIAPLNEAAFKKLQPSDSMSSSRVCSPSPCESIDTITDGEDINDDDLCGADRHEHEIAMIATTPINETGEKMYPPYNNNTTNNNNQRATTSGTPTPTTTPAATPTPTASAAQQYAAQHLFGSKWDKLHNATSATTAPTTPNDAFMQDLFNDSDISNISSSNDISGSMGNQQQQRSLKSYLHSFDRRNSDTNYLLGRRSSGERVNLADEIRKLSDHLLMLADINTKLGNNAKRVNEISPLAKTTTNEQQAQLQLHDAAKEQMSNDKIVKHSATTKTTTTTSSTKLKTTNKSNGSATTTGSSKPKLSSISKRLEQSIEDMPKLINGNAIAKTSATTETHSQTTTLQTLLPWQHNQKSKHTTTNATKSNSSLTTANACNNANAIQTSTSKTKNAQNHSNNSNNVSNVNGASATESASVKRAKFRITHMSRDVPVGLPDTHQTVNLEEAANTTKDCLLHLLEKYNDTKCRNPMARHQSISVDWNVSDNLEYRSMSSINAFFQRHNNTGGAHVKQMQAQLEQKTKAAKLTAAAAASAAAATTTTNTTSSSTSIATSSSLSSTSMSSSSMTMPKKASNVKSAAAGT